MSDDPKERNSLVISYLMLRKVIGVLGISFPFVLSLGALILFKTGLQISISNYYYTGMGDVFVGTLFVIGFFLFAYKGYDGDYIAGRIGWIAAVGAALVPAHETPEHTDIFGYIHIAFAGLFFITLIYFSLVLFPKTGPEPPTSKKLQRNKVYKAAGYIMIACIVLIVVYYFLPEDIASIIEAYQPVFWLESIAIIAFGISWLTKGQAILQDPS